MRTPAVPSSVVRVILGGDLMLGRLVADTLRERGATYPIDPIAARMRAADLTLVNLECALTDTTRRWSGAPKAFYFAEPISGVGALRHAGVDLVSLANNHILDFDFEGLAETLAVLRRNDIAYTGAGVDLEEARTPAIVERGGIRFGMTAYCDHQSDFAAGPGRPGMAFVDLEDEERALAMFREDLSRMSALHVDWPILSLHWGPNMVDAPSPRFVRIAHAVIDAGYRTLFGHSAHVFHRVELRKGFPILYAAGDLVDDYYVDPEFRNDHQLLFEIELTQDQVRSIHLHPVFLQGCRTLPAEGEAFDLIVERMRRLCAAAGMEVRREGQDVWVETSRAHG